MDSESSKKILKNLVFIKENITQLGKVMDKLIENEYISMDEKADILTERGIDTQCHILLETLIKRGGNAFHAFIEALQVSGNGHVAEKILQTDLSVQDEQQIQREETFFQIEDRQDEIIQLIKERELFKMKFNELMVKYTKLKDENKTKSEDIEALNQEIQKLKDKLSSIEKKALQIGSEVETGQKDIQKIPKFKTKKFEGSRSSKAEGFDFVDCQPTKRSTEMDKDERTVQENLVEKLQQQTAFIEELKNDAKNYSNLVGVLEDQVDDLKAAVSERDDKIMKLKNSVGKLQIYLEAGKHERERLSSELRQEMDKNQKDTEERFNKIDDKMDQIIKLMTYTKNTVKPLDIITPMKSPRSVRQNKFNKKFR